MISHVELGRIFPFVFLKILIHAVIFSLGDALREPNEFKLFDGVFRPLLVDFKEIFDLGFFDLLPVAIVALVVALEAKGKLAEEVLVD